MKPCAFSYTRFSTQEQSKGKSLERQTEAAALWCKNNNAVLDTELSLHDAGISAFRGKNSDTGALSLFLKAVHAGSVPVGSFLLIETFDRLSRAAAYDAQLCLQNIINAGVTVVTLLDQKQYNVSILRADPIALIYAILLMSRSHEESSTKSKRVADAWSRKRKAIADGTKLTKVTPTWITTDHQGHFKVIPKHAHTLELIYKLFLDGNGYGSIAAHLNRKKLPTFRSAPYWGSGFIHKLLKNRSVIGEFQPHREDTSQRTRKRTPEGKPIENYYPVIIKPRIFDRVQVMLKANKRPPRVAPKLRMKNILAGLARCPHCQQLMTRSSKQADLRARLACTRAIMGAGCKYKSVRLDLLESTLIANAGTLVTKIPVADDTVQRRIAETETALKLNEAKQFDLAMLLDGTPSRVIAERIRIAEGECEKLRVELEALQVQAQYGNTKRIKDNAQRMREALAWHAQDDSDVAAVNSSLRECFSQIVVDVDNRQLSMHWRHGGVATLAY